MWIDKRGNWHMLVEGNPMPGGHAWSTDGITWSNISGANGEHALQGCFNDSRPYMTRSGELRNVSYYTERPKLVLGGADGFTPTHLLGGAGPVPPGTSSFTVVSPLATAAPVDHSSRPDNTARELWSSDVRSGWMETPDPSVRIVHVINSCHLDIGFADTAQNIVNDYFDKHLPLAASVGAELRADAADGNFTDDKLNFM